METSDHVEVKLHACSQAQGNSIYVNSATLARLADYTSSSYGYFKYLREHLHADQAKQSEKETVTSLKKTDHRDSSVTNACSSVRCMFLCN